MIIETYFDVPTESPVWSGRVVSTEYLSPGTAIQAPVGGGWGINAVVKRARQHWIGVGRGGHVTKTEAEAETVLPQFLRHVSVTGYYTIEQIGQKARIEVPNDAPTEPILINFEGNAGELIQYIADICGKRWYVESTGRPVYYEPVVNPQMMWPSQCYEAVYETGWFGAEIWNGVEYDKNVLKEETIDHRVTIRREKCHIVLEKPFYSGGKVYAIVRLEQVEHLPYEDIVSIYDRQPPEGSNFTLGLTSFKNPEVREFDVLETRSYTDSGRVLSGVKVVARVAVPYQSSASDPNAATIDKAWEDYLDNLPDLTIRFKVKALVQRPVRTHMGSSPYLEIDVPNLPGVFQDKYAAKMLYLNGLRKKMRVTYLIKDSNQEIPRLEPGIERIIYEWNALEGVSLVTVEYVG